MNRLHILKKMFLIGFLGVIGTSSYAGPGHDHGESAVAQNNVGAPQRQVNGDVFLPKSAQRQLAIETDVVEEGSFSKTYDLSGMVIMDPNFGGKVQAIVAGRITPGPKGFPLPGQVVKKGEVLAYVTPETGPSGSRSLAESRLKRLRELSDTVPRKTIEEAEAAVANEELRAPVSGVISTMGIVSGQVVEARQLVFEVVNPNKLLIEALVYDNGLVGNISGASIAINDKVINLKYLGGGQALREQALPIMFAVDSQDISGLPVGQPVRVLVHTKSQVKGWKVSATALVKNSSNQNIVWVKKMPEVFEPKAVLFEPLDGKSLVITSGVKNRDRLVTKSATLLNQIR